MLVEKTPGHLSQSDLIELEAAEDRIVSQAPGPVPVLVQIGRYIGMVDREHVFRAYYADVAVDLILSDDGVKITRAGDRLSLVGVYKVSEVNEYTATEEGVAFNFKGGAVYLTCSDPMRVLAVFIAIIQGLVYKRDHSHDRPRVLPHHRGLTNEQRASENRHFAEILFAKLMENKTDVFDLSWSSIGGEMLGPLLEALDVNQSVKTVDLSGFSQGFDDVMRVLKVIEGKPTIRNVNLNYTGLNDVAAEKLSSFIINNKYVTSINLAFNALTSVGVRTLIGALRQNSTLLSVAIQVPTIEDARLTYWNERLYSMREKK
jgi:hypothetical protein